MAAKTNGRMVFVEPKAADSRIIRHSMVYDANPLNITNSPTPTSIASILDRVDRGELWLLCALQQEMERKSDQFHGLVRTRRTAVTALEWTIEPDQNADEDDPFAKEVTDYCSDKLASIPSWPRALEHLSEAIGPNLAVLELVWDKAELAEFVTVPYTRLRAHPFTNTGVAIMLDEEPMGFPTEMLPGKFVVFVPNSRGGFPFRNSLTHASVMAYLAIHFGRADWLSFSELFGTPVRVGTYDESIVDADRQTLEDLLDGMGTDAATMLPKGVTVDFKQAVGTGETYPKLLDYADTKLAILWLGQTLTTDIGAVGSFAAAKVHDNVRGSILAADLQAEAYCVREQILRPMVELRFPGKNVPIPCFHRKTSVRRDIELERLVLEQLAFAAKQGLAVNSDWLYESLKIPRPESGRLPDVIRLKEPMGVAKGNAPDNNAPADEKNLRGPSEKSAAS